ncbi:MAG: serine/threonine-protein phosphatase, partial [Candidatus Dormibacteraeota bacterium]|nr:serine/threonine-protein phosphatase [Candidatus Dormibacteraeota bacterium]
ATPPTGAADGRWVTERDRVEVALSTLAGVSDRGLRRERNEDALALASLDGGDARIAVVCDGVSTSTEAAAASESAAKAAHAHLVKAVRAGRTDLTDSMRQAVAAAHEAVRAISDGRAASDDAPASTLVAAVLRGRDVTIGWIGDSRAYFVGSTEGWQLTNDDTWAGDQVRLGLMSEAEAAADPRAHALTGWLGGEQEDAPEPSVSNFELATPGCLLLCTDGLWNYAPGVERLRELVLKSYAPSPLEMARELTDFARAAGGEDNITVVIGFV